MYTQVSFQYFLVRNIAVTEFQKHSQGVNFKSVCSKISSKIHFYLTINQKYLSSQVIRKGVPYEQYGMDLKYSQQVKQPTKYICIK